MNKLIVDNGITYFEYEYEEYKARIAKCLEDDLIS